MLCANCDNKGVFTTMTAIGEKAFCCEKCYAEYVGLPIEKEGYYGFMAETFEASVVHRGKKPKGAIGKAMMNRAMIERAEIESVIQELENKVQLGIISEDDLMKSLTQRFGAEFEVIDWNNLHDTNRELFVQKLQEYYDDFKENNPELHKEFEERIMNEESWYGYERGKSYAETKEKWTKKLSDLGYEYERIDDYWEYIGYDNTPVYEHCNYCDGEGIIITKYYPATREDPADADYVDCEMCEGKGKVLEEMNAETFEEACFRCGCKGDYDDGDEINLVYCELCDDYWCNDACREPSCWDRHYNYTCTRNAAETFEAEIDDGMVEYMKTAVNSAKGSLEGLENEFDSMTAPRLQTKARKYTKGIKGNLEFLDERLKDSFYAEWEGNWAKYERIVNRLNEAGFTIDKEIKGEKGDGDRWEFKPEIEIPLSGIIKTEDTPNPIYRFVVIDTEGEGEDGERNFFLYLDTIIDNTDSPILDWNDEQRDFFEKEIYDLLKEKGIVKSDYWYDEYGFNSALNFTYSPEIIYINDFEKECSHENLSIKTMEVLNGELLLTLDCDNCGKRTSTSASLNQDSFYAETKKRKTGFRKCSKCGYSDHNSSNCNRLDEYEAYRKHKDEMLKECDDAIQRFTKEAKRYSEDGEYGLAKMLRSDATDMKKLKRMIENNHFGKAVHFAMTMDSDPRELAPSALWMFYDAEEVKLSKTSCCCGATESNPCACMKAPEPMNCSATEPKCPCYKDLEKNAEYDDGYDPCEECGVHLGDYYVCPYCYPEEFEELDAETYNAEEKGKRKIGETVAWNNRIIGMDGKWLDGKYDLYEIGNQIGYAVVHQDLKSFEYKLEQNGVLLGSKGTDIAQISFAGLNIYTGGDGSFPIVGLYEDIEEYYSRTQNKPHPTKNLSIDEELENYEKNNYLEAKWEDEFTEWAKTVYDFKPQYYSDGTEISLSYYEAKRILQENHKVLVGARITIRNPSMPNLERQNSKSSVWVLEYPDIRKITQGQNGRIKRETNTIFINTEKTVDKIFANLQKKYPKGMISEGRYGKSFIISIPFFGKYRWDANKYNLVYDSLSDEEKKRRESLESKKRQKEYEQKRKEQQEALKAKYGAEEGDDCPNCHCEHQNLSLDGTPDVDEEYVSVNVVCDDCGMKGYTTTYPYEWDNEAKLEDVGLPLAVNMNNPNYGELRCSRCRERFEKSAENYVLDVE